MQLGNLIITPAALTVKAQDKTSVYGTALPAFTSTVSGYQYDDDSAKVMSGPPLYSIVNSAGQIVSGAIAPGTYKIRPSLQLKVPASYTVNPIEGTLIISAAALTVKAETKAIFKGDPLPAFTSAYTGFCK
jgi:hypothetical protein